MPTDDLRFETVDPTGPEATAAVERYFAELATRFDGGFDRTSYQGSGVAARSSEWFVVCRRGDRTVGCGAVLLLDAETVEIKRMWVDPVVRGAGIGRRLLTALEEVGRRAGATTVRLDTNGTLAEAIRLYERAGYRRIDRYNDNPYAQLWFEKFLTDRDTVEQMFDSFP